MGNSLLFKACPDTIVDPRETLCYDPHTQITHPTILCHDKRNKSQSYVMTCYDTLVVEVTAIVNEDDACSMAVYFGPRSRFNRRAVKDGCDWRSGMAFVVFEALTNALKVRSKVSHRINRVLVMADDEHLIDVLTSDTPASDLGSVMIGQIRRRIYESAREGIKVSELQCCLDVIYSSNQVKFWYFFIQFLDWKTHD